MARKNSNVAHREHVNIVARKLLEFWPPWRIKSELGPEFGLSDPMMDVLLQKTTAQIVNKVGSFDEEYKKHIQRGHHLIAACLEKGDFKTASTMFAALSRLGMERQNVDVTTGGVPLVSFANAVEGLQASAQTLALSEGTDKALDAQAHADPGSSSHSIEAGDGAQNGPENEPTQAS